VGNDQRIHMGTTHMANDGNVRETNSDDWILREYRSHYREKEDKSAPTGPFVPVGGEPPDPPDPPRSAGEDPDGISDIMRRLESAGFTHVNLIGKGGMAFVFKGVDPDTSAYVAIKVMRIHSGAETNIRRFLREIVTTAKLDHPNIVGIRTGLSDLPPGLCYFTMQLVPGRSLAELMHPESAGGKARREFANAHPNSYMREAAVLVRDIANAVAYLHARSVFHRDLKPANVLVIEHWTDTELGETPSPTSPLPADAKVFGHPMVADFGLASAEWDEESLTQSLDRLGTPRYMAPEQARSGRGADEAVDIWALGMILYELLTLGRHPFDTGSGQLPPRVDLLDLIRSSKEIPARSAARTRNPQIPHDLNTICMKCLSKLPAERYASANLVADLDSFLAGQPIAARPFSAFERIWKWVKRNRRLVTVVSAVVLVAAGAIASILWLEHERAAKAKKLLAERRHEYDEIKVLDVAQPPEEEQLHDLCQRFGQKWNASSLDLEEAIEVRLALVRRGQSSLLLGRFDDAVRELSEAIEFLGDNPELQRRESANYHVIQLLAHGTRAEAYEHLARSVLPLSPSLDAARRAEVKVGALNLARALVDLDFLQRKLPQVNGSAPLDFTVSVETMNKATAAWPLNLTRLRPYLGLFRTAGDLEAAVAVADVLDECPTLYAADAHYEVAGIYADAVSAGTKGDRDVYAAAAVRHLERGVQNGLGSVPGRPSRVGPSPSLRDRLLSDPVFNAIRQHPQFVTFVNGLPPAAPPRK
jgi:serine/threonine protein kinase